jgi:hypothetical protein
LELLANVFFTLIATLSPETKLWIKTHTHLKDLSSEGLLEERSLHLVIDLFEVNLKITPFMFFSMQFMNCFMKDNHLSSRLLRPCIKAVCDGRTTWSARVFSLNISTLVKLLKLTLRRHIGWYSWILSASLILGNKLISPKFRRNNSSCSVWRSPNKASRPGLTTSQKTDRTQLGSHLDPKSYCAPFGKPLYVLHHRCKV